MIDWIYWIDVCPVDGNLVTMGGRDQKIHIYDRRSEKSVKTFNEIHTGNVYVAFES